MVNEIVCALDRILYSCRLKSPPNEATGMRMKPLPAAGSPVPLIRQIANANVLAAAVVMLAGSFGTPKAVNVGTEGLVSNGAEVLAPLTANARADMKLAPPVEMVMTSPVTGQAEGANFQNTARAPPF